jgi:hypothetical protein
MRLYSIELFHERPVILFVLPKRTDRKVEFVVWVADHADERRSRESAFDDIAGGKGRAIELIPKENWPYQVQLKTPSTFSCNHSPFDCCRLLISYKKNKSAAKYKIGHVEIN